MFTKVVTICENTSGKDTPVTAIAYGDSGLLWHVKGYYDSAIEMRKRTLLSQESILGNNSDTAQVYINIGGVCYEKKEYNRASSMFTKAKKSRRL